MKNLTYLLLPLLLLIAVFEACNKQALAPQYQGKLVASSTSVNPNEIDSLILVGADNDSVTWNITPHNYTVIKKQNNKMILYFWELGNYAVTATVNGKSQTIYVGCYDNGTYTPVPLTDAPIIITPHYYHSTTNASPDSTYFTLTAQIQKTMTCSNDGIDFRVNRTDNNFTIVFIGYNQPDTKHCLPPNVNATYPQMTFPFYQDPDFKPYFINTSYPLTIKVGDKTYTGTLKGSTTALDIVWDYTSGVTMSTKHVAINN